MRAIINRLLAPAPDPYELAAAMYNSPGGDFPSHHGYRLRAAVNAALIADRRRRPWYWLRLARQKLLWVGGWEEPNCGGWRPTWEYGLKSPFPVTVLSSLTLFGGWWQCRIFGTYLTWSHGKVYLSPDGTPRSATRWFSKKPEFL
jgi:hypothetical protein